MQHNDLRKGMKVLLTGGRMGTIQDNRKGIRRCVKIEERDGWYGDMGDVYVDEITWKWTSEAEHEIDPDLPYLREVKLSPAHAKQMAKIRGQLKEIFG